MTIDATINKLTKYQNWRTGIIDEWSKKDRVPPGEELSEVINSALYYLDQYKETVWKPASSISEVWSPKAIEPSKKQSKPSSSKSSSRKKTKSS